MKGPARSTTPDVMKWLEYQYSLYDFDHSAYAHNTCFGHRTSDSGEDTYSLRSKFSYSFLNCRQISVKFPTDHFSQSAKRRSIPCNHCNTDTERVSQSSHDSIQNSIQIQETSITSTNVRKYKEAGAAAYLVRNAGLDWAVSETGKQRGPKTHPPTFYSFLDSLAAAWWTWTTAVSTQLSPEMKSNGIVTRFWRLL